MAMKVMVVMTKTSAHPITSSQCRERWMCTRTPAGGGVANRWNIPHTHTHTRARAVCTHHGTAQRGDKGGIDESRRNPREPRRGEGGGVARNQADNC